MDHVCSPRLAMAEAALFNTARNLDIAAPLRRQPLGMHSCLKGMNDAQPVTTLRGMAELCSNGAAMQRSMNATNSRALALTIPPGGNTAHRSCAGSSQSSSTDL